MGMKREAVQVGAVEVGFPVLVVGRHPSVPFVCCMMSAGVTLRGSGNFCVSESLAFGGDCGV